MAQARFCGVGGRGEGEELWKKDSPASYLLPPEELRLKLQSCLHGGAPSRPENAKLVGKHQDQQRMRPLWKGGGRPLPDPTVHSPPAPGLSAGSRVWPSPLGPLRPCCLAAAPERRWWPRAGTA